MAPRNQPRKIAKSQIASNMRSSVFFDCRLPDNIGDGARHGGSVAAVCFEPTTYSTWGTYRPIWPSQFRTPSNLRLAVFGSHWRGMRLVSKALSLQRTEPGLLELVGLATDDVDDPNARISKQRRVWRYTDPKVASARQDALIRSCLNAGIPVFTGNVKSSQFRNEILADWRPDLIVMGTFGQLIDAPIIESPRWGMFNFHPSDLSAGKYPGADPFTEMIAAGERHTRVTMHVVDAGFDTGQPMGASSPILTGVDAMMRLDIDPQILDPIWMDALHWTTAVAAGRMAAILIKKTARATSAVRFSDFQSTFPHTLFADLQNEVERYVLKHLNRLALREQSDELVKDRRTQPLSTNATDVTSGRRTPKTSARL